MAASWFRIFPAAAVVAAAPAAATVYLSVPEAQAALFPGARFLEHPLTLSDAQRKAISRAAGAPAYDKVQRVWEVRSGDRRAGWFMVDRVIGKHEFITYALALGPDGTVRGIEILEYRETYGGEIRNPNWRRQFVGKRPGSGTSARWRHQEYFRRNPFVTACDRRSAPASRHLSDAAGQHLTCAAAAPCSAHMSR